MFRAFTRPRYQVSVYRTIGPLVVLSFLLAYLDYICDSKVLIREKVPK